MPPLKVKEEVVIKEEKQEEIVMPEVRGEEGGRLLRRGSFI